MKTSEKVRELMVEESNASWGEVPITDLAAILAEVEALEAENVRVTDIYCRQAETIRELEAERGLQQEHYNEQLKVAKLHFTRNAKIEAYEHCSKICEKHGIDAVSEIWQEIDDTRDALKAGK